MNSCGSKCELKSTVQNQENSQYPTIKKETLLYDNLSNGKPHKITTESHWHIPDLSTFKGNSLFHL
jgi:hypothetical protein